MVIKFSPDGQGADDDRPAARIRSTSSSTMPGSGAYSAAEQAVLVQPPDRRRLGSAGQHLRLRRLRRLARREVRQERPVHQVGRHARQRAGCSSARRTRSRSDAQGNVYVGDRGNARVQVLDNDLNSEGDLRPASAARGRCASRPGRISIFTCSNSVPDSGDSRAGGARPARSTRWSSTARSSASSARPARRSKEFSTHPPDGLPQPERALRRRDHRLARAEDPAASPQAMKSSAGDRRTR